MKTCIHCGAQMDDTCNFCPNCGTRCNDQNDMERSVYQPYEEPRESVPEVRAEQYPMKWHKFLMVVMIISAVFTIINGISFIAGFEYSEYQFTKYGASASMVYNAFPGLKTCDTFYGVAMIALGVFEFTARNRLKQFRMNGPGSLKIMYVLSIGACIIYLIWASAVTKINLLNGANLASLGISVLLLVINSVYYSKRSALFVN